MLVISATAPPIDLLGSPKDRRGNDSAGPSSRAAELALKASASGESGLDPSRLELEITESVMLDAEGPALAMLQNLREIGSRPIPPERIGSFLSHRTGFASRELIESTAMAGDTR